MQTRRPACWSWSRTEDLSSFHAGHCALCGQHHTELVRDHCHDTGWIRGLLCSPCNSLEGRTWRGHRAVRLYRKRPPAKILGIWERYSSPYGPDFGKLQGIPTWEPHIVTTSGVVLLVGLQGRDHRTGELRWFDTAEQARPSLSDTQWCTERTAAQRTLGFDPGLRMIDRKAVQVPANALSDPDLAAFEIGVFVLVRTCLANRGAVDADDLIDLACRYGPDTGLGYGDAGVFFDAVDRLIASGYLPKNAVAAESARDEWLRDE